MSESIRKEDFVNNLLTLLVETFESPPGPASTYLDQKAGLFDTLERVSAEQASKPVANGATSIASPSRAYTLLRGRRGAIYERTNPKS